MLVKAVLVIKVLLVGFTIYLLSHAATSVSKNPCLTFVLGGARSGCGWRILSHWRPAHARDLAPGKALALFLCAT